MRGDAIVGLMRWRLIPFPLGSPRVWYCVLKLKDGLKYAFVNVRDECMLQDTTKCHRYLHSTPRSLLLIRPAREHLSSFLQYAL
jgi:hypothetical protein